MINATALCKAGNKLIADYLRLQNTKDSLKALELDMGIPISEIMELNLGGHAGTWVHRKIGYHLAQWISPEFSVRVSNILDEFFITGSVSLQTTELQEKIDEWQQKHQTLLIKHNSTLKNHRYIKFKETGPCFYIIEQGIPCECKYSIERKKFGIAGLSKHEKEPDTFDDRLKCHRTNWPQLKINFVIFLKEVEALENSIKRIYSTEINPNGHEIIEGVTTEQFVTTIMKFLEACGITDYQILSEERIKEYNDYVITTVKSK
jgi:hypothetical protein